MHRSIYPLEIISKVVKIQNHPRQKIDYIYILNFQSNYIESEFDSREKFTEDRMAKFQKFMSKYM